MPENEGSASWVEGIVTIDREHIRLTYGFVSTTDHFSAVALLAPGPDGAPRQFVVQRLAVPEWDQLTANATWDEVRRSLDFYLVELRKPDPWAYAIYHCGTAANIYSDVHWNYCPTERVCALPDQGITHFRLVEPTSLFQTEGAGTFWLSAWPELLGWSTEIEWLFAPVTGNTAWPGDLWGVDQRGELLLVETKRTKKRERTHDPYRDFVGFAARQAAPDQATLVRRWLALLKHEQSFITDRLGDLQSGQRVLETRPGIVDYSLKRMMVWRWRELYLRQIAPRVMSGDYEQAVHRNLAAREAAGNPLPHYFALFTRYDDTYPQLSAKGKIHYAELAAMVGSDHVHARQVSAWVEDNKRVRVRSLPAYITDEDL